MPWWFWVISHIWVMCSAGLFVGMMSDGDFEDQEIIWKVFLFIISLFGPLTIIFAVSGALLQEKEVWDKIKDRWFFRKIRQTFKWFKNYRKRQKDFKEIEDNEDEWTAERVGIKLK
jgi:hypothetical protein